MPRINPLISIFIPYYNDEQFLKQSIESVLNNDYQNFELILLNHATTDSSREIAHSYNDTRIKYIDMDINYGGGSGLLFEKMLSIANGKYIKPFCADDILKKDGLKILVEYMENNPNKDFAFGDVEYVDENGKDLQCNFFSDRKYFSVQNNEIKCIKLYARGISFLPFVGSIVKTILLKKIPINKTYLMTFDMSLWLNLLVRGHKIGYVEKLVANYRIHNGQISSIKNKKIALLRSYLEHKTFYKIFYSITDVELAKKVFSNSPFVNKLNHCGDIKFFIAHSLLMLNTTFHNSVAEIDEMLNDEIKRKRIEQVFGYTIKDFREDIINNKQYKKLSFKGKIYDKSTKDLNLFDLCFLGMRKIFMATTLFKLRHKGKKAYSL